MRKKKKKDNRIWNLTIRLAVTVFVVAGIIVLLPSAKKPGNTEATAQGMEYLKAAEQKDVSSVSKRIDQNSQLEELEGLDTFEALNQLDTYLMGDSRVIGFEYTDFDPNHIMAEGNTTIKYIDERLADIVAARPRFLVLSFGMNDLGMYEYDPDNYWGTGEEYAQAYKEYVDKIHEAVPETTVIINLILPATEAGYSRQERWLLVDDYNAALVNMCKANGIPYVDMSDICYANPQFYGEDGVHFAFEIYPIWSEEILKVIKENL